MIDLFKELIANQFEAVLCTLNICIDKCPEDLWNAPAGDYKFCQVAFHAVFYADYYLGLNEDVFREQPFHRDNADFFGDYEELEDRVPVRLYDRAAIKRYVNFCHQKALEVIASETEASLAARSGFGRRAISRAELYIYNIRHLQDHASQLGGQLERDAHVAVPWVGSGWHEV